MSQKAESAGVAAQTESPPGTPTLGGRYVLSEQVRETLFGTLHRGRRRDNNDPVSILLLRQELMASSDIRAQTLDGARAAMDLAHPNLGKTIDVIAEDNAIVLDYLDGQTAHDLLQSRGGGRGLDGRAAKNITVAIANAVCAIHARMPHGALDLSTIYIGRAGRVRLAFLGLGAGLAAAVAAKQLATPPHMAPEIARRGSPSALGDVSSLASVLYELLVGRGLVKGGPRPSERAGVAAAIDEVVAKSVAPEPGNRPAPETFLKTLTRAFAQPVAAKQRAAANRPSLATAIAEPQTSGPATPRTSAELAAQALTSAMADTAEKWLVTKGKMDYGPYSLAQVVDEIRANQIEPGHFIIDNETGQRYQAQDHPLLSHAVDQAKQLRDDQRRAQAEVAHASQEKRRGVALYAVIGAGVVALVLVAYFAVTALSKDKTSEHETVSAIGDDDTIALEFPKESKTKRRRRGKRRSARARTAGSSASGSETGSNAVNFDDDGGDEYLDSATLYRVIARKGGSLKRCVLSSGVGYVKISYSVANTGRVTRVSVNGKSSGSLYSCINSVMRSMKFPRFNGTFTNSTFDMRAQ